MCCDNRIEGIGKFSLTNFYCKLTISFRMCQSIPEIFGGYRLSEYIGMNIQHARFKRHSKYNDLFAAIKSVTERERIQF